MSIKSEIVGTWQDWKKGVMACCILGMSLLMAFVASSLSSVIIVMGFHLVAGGKASDDAIYSLAYVLGVLFVPISINIGVDTLSENNKEALIMGDVE